MRCTSSCPAASTTSPRPAAATPTTAGSCRDLARPAGRCASTPSPAPGRARTPPPAPSWPGRSPRCPTARSCSLDGLVACGVPEIVVPRRAGCALVVLVHLPLADETGLRRPRRSWTPASGRSCAPRGGRGHQRLGRPPARRPPRARPRPGHVADPGRRPRAARPRHRRRIAAAVRRRGDPAQGPGPAGRGARRRSPTCPGLRAASAGCAATPGYVDAVRAADRAARPRPTGCASPARRPARTSTRPTPRADLLVLPSHAETYGMVVTEALARGIPVLATRRWAGCRRRSAAPRRRRARDCSSRPDAAALACRAAPLARRPGPARRGCGARPHRRRGMLDGWETTSRSLAEVLDPNCGGTPA